MLDSSHEFSGPTQPLDREGPEVMQAFVGRHAAFFILLAVMVAQLLLLSVQITRGHKVRLIQVWAVAVFDPFARSVHWVTGSIGGTWRKYSGLLHAREENQKLKHELDAARSQNQMLAGQAAQADSLRATLELKKSLAFETLAAEVIARSPGEGANAVFIDKGSNDGLRTSLPVITPEGVVGKIIAVFPRSSQVLLITDPASGVGCMLEKTGIQGVLKGGSRDLPQLNYVVNEHPVTVGEKILTSGLDQIYPKGLPVGVVVRSSEGHIYKNIVVQPAAHLDQLETVLVALNPLQDQSADAKPTSQR